ncbi:hypothetical protein Tco_0004156 [Tanacetum coccineum]
MKCPQHYLTEIQEVVLFYNGLDVPTRQILDSRGAVPTMTATDAKKATQEMAEYSQKWHNGTSRGRSTKTSDELAAIQAQLNNLGREIKKVGGYRATAPRYYQRDNTNPSYQERRQSMEDTLSKFMSESARRHEENSNLIKEIRALTDAAIRNQGSSIKTLEIQIGQMSKEKDLGSFTLPCFINNVCFDNSFVARVSVMPLLTYLNLGLGELAHTKLTVELADRIVKYPKGIAENVLVRIDPLDPFLEDYIELNDLNEPFKLRRNQVDDLMPTIKEGEVIKIFRTRDKDLDTGIDDYPSYCDDDTKIHKDFLEDMDAYRDEGMGDVIVGKPFLREVGIKARRFDGMITIYNGK